MNAAGTMPVYFLSHGGGPWPWMEEMSAAYAELARSLRALPAELPSLPLAILCISAHWETEHFTVQTSPQPGMLYDYFGFPAQTYSIRYPAPGSPELAVRTRELLSGAGFAADEDSRRGFDHGVYSPLSVAFPDADIPIMQLSIRSSYSPAEHLAAGRALAPLRNEGVLIVGSGLSYHNLRALGPVGAEPSQLFDHWLAETMLNSTPATRHERLLEWQKAPSAREAHPREDHLIPLMVAVGAAAEEKATRNYHEERFFGAITASSYRLG